MMSDDGIQDLVAYIATLPNEPVTHTIKGDVAHGLWVSGEVISAPA